MKKKTILQIVPSLISGGIERGVVEINNYLVKNGFNSIVLSSGGKLVYQIEQGGGKHITLDVATKNPIKIWKNISNIKNIIKENDVDLVHVRSRAPAWSAYYACKSIKCPLVSTIHGNYSIGCFPISIFKKWYNSSMIKADRIICVSNYIKEYAYDNYPMFREKFTNSHTKVIHRGVDINVFNPDNISQERLASLISKIQLPDDKQVILLPGRLTEWKGQLYFLEVLSRMKNRNFICIILGDSKGHERYRDRLKSRIIELGLDSNVRLENNILDMSACYLLSDIVVSTSIRGEAFGRIIPEAQAMKKMAVATAIGGSLETVIDGETGWLVRPEKIEDFAEILDKILAMPQSERNIIGEKAREHIINHYTVEKMCNKTVDLYNEIFNEGI